MSPGVLLQETSNYLALSVTKTQKWGTEQDWTEDTEGLQEERGWASHDTSSPSPPALRGYGRRSCSPLVCAPRRESDQDESHTRTALLPLFLQG